MRMNSRCMWRAKGMTSLLSYVHCPSTVYNKRLKKCEGGPGALAGLGGELEGAVGLGLGGVGGDGALGRGAQQLPDAGRLLLRARYPLARLAPLRPGIIKSTELIIYFVIPFVPVSRETICKRMMIHLKRVLRRLSTLCYRNQSVYVTIRGPCQGWQASELLPRRVGSLPPPACEQPAAPGPSDTTLSIP